MNHGGAGDTGTHGELDGYVHSREGRERANHVAGQVIEAAVEVHRVLDPGLLESVYEECLARELALNEVRFRRQVLLPVRYKGRPVDACFRVDLLVENLVVVELKAVQRIEETHQAQLLTYLRLGGRWLGLLLNFHAALLKRGVQRMVNS
jgi:GxxExxY protein